MRTQMQAIALGLIGLLLASPVTPRIATALSPARAGSATDVYANAAETGWSRMVLVGSPLVQIVGILLAVVAVAALLLRGPNAAFRRPIGPLALNNGLAVLLGALTAVMIVLHPPHIDRGALEFTHTAARIGSGVTGSTSWTTPTATPTPSNRN